MRISDWSSDVCSSDLDAFARMKERGDGTIVNVIGMAGRQPRWDYVCGGAGNAALAAFTNAVGGRSPEWGVRVFGIHPSATRSEEHTSELQSLMRISYAVFCLKKKKQNQRKLRNAER